MIPIYRHRPRERAQISCHQLRADLENLDGNPVPEAGFGSLPLYAASELKEKLLDEMIKKGGILLPMRQAEGLRIEFQPALPFIIKVTVDTVNAPQDSPGLKIP
ncbi:hypothetical protein BDZ45DRAFT_380471 [Acephala macrosclerotiorum]|nr:hypothetical protein BDZ45DRAFT_380471 [Acephala macrosclerotiorum]